MHGGIISKSSNYGKIEMPEEGFYGIGGIAGLNGSTENASRIEKCYNEGEVYSKTNMEKGKQAGGIVGNAASTSTTYPIEIISCYNTGYVHGLGQIGGLIGFGRDVTVENCYNIGQLLLEEENNGRTGGIIALLNGTNNKIENNYWLDNSGAIYGIASKNTDEGAEKLTESQLKSISNELGEDYEVDKNNLNQGYPYLKENKPE